MGRNSGYKMVYRERGVGPRWVFVPYHPWRNTMNVAWRAALKYAADVSLMASACQFCQVPSQRPAAPAHVAQFVLHLLAIVDRQDERECADALKFACAAIMTMRGDERALMYYDACSVLGYDPAEDVAPPCRVF